MSLGVRPEHLLPSGEGDVVIKGKVQVVEKLGNETQVYLNLDHVDADFIYRENDTLEVDSGDHFEIGIPAHRCHLFHSDGRACQRLFKERGI